MALRTVLALCSAVLMMLPPAAAAEEITVSAALSLKNAIEEIGRLYEARNKGGKAIFNFGASGELARQIEGGAPVDVFISAAQKDMDGLEKKGLIAPGTRVSVATNTVVLIVPAAAKETVRSFQGLASAAVKKIAVGNPATVPAGRYAEEVFRYYRIHDTIKDKFILTENVRQALDYVARGEVDAGVVYGTDALVRTKEVRVAAVAPGASHRPVVYPIAVVKGAKSAGAARAFVALVVSAEGKRILEKHGFTIGK